LNLTSDIIPNRLVLKKLEAQEAENQQRALQAEETKGLAAAKLQIDGQKEMAAGAQALKSEELQLEREKFGVTTNLTTEKLARREAEKVADLQSNIQMHVDEIQQREAESKRDAAVKLALKKGEIVAE
jgi:hypothetical protein